MKLLFIFFLATFFSPLAHSAGRTAIAPRFAWHDWYHNTYWCDGTVASNGAFYRNIEISITNISSREQHIKITCTPTEVKGWADATNVLMTHVWMNDVSGRSDPSAALVKNITLAANGNASVTCGGVYQGPAGGLGDNFYHLTGAFDVKFEVTEDRGAVTAVMNSQMESTGCTNYSVNDNVGTAISNLRNPGRMILVNGGSPF